MENQNRTFLLSAVMGLGVTAAAAVRKHNEAGSGDARLRSAFAPLTGNNMQYGVSFQNAINMKVEEINNAGGINGQQIKIVSMTIRVTRRKR